MPSSGLCVLARQACQNRTMVRSYEEARTLRKSSTSLEMRPPIIATSDTAIAMWKRVGIGLGFAPFHYPTANVGNGWKADIAFEAADRGDVSMRKWWLVGLLSIVFFLGLAWKIIDVKYCTDEGGVVVAPLTGHQRCVSR